MGKGVYGLLEEKSWNKVESSDSEIYDIVVDGIEQI